MPNFKDRNIIIGAAAVYLSAADSTSAGWNAVALPASVSGTPFTGSLDADANNWRSTGYTSDGVEFAYTPDYGEVEVDQLLDAAKLFKQKMTATVKTTFAEATLENLMVVWAQGGSSRRRYGAAPVNIEDVTGVARDVTKDFEGVTVPKQEEVLGIEAGALGIEPVERQIVFVGNSPRTYNPATPAEDNKKRERIYHVRRALSVEATTHSLKRNEATLFPVTFRLLPSTVSGAEYGTIRDRVITAIA